MCALGASLGAGQRWSVLILLLLLPLAAAKFPHHPHQHGHSRGHRSGHKGHDLQLLVDNDNEEFLRIPENEPDYEDHTVHPKTTDDHQKELKLTKSHEDFYKSLFVGFSTTSTTKTTVSSDSDHPQSTQPQLNRARMANPQGKGLLDVRKANEHYLKVRNEARCKEPKPRVIKVKDYYPDASKEYLPRCTILHRCGDDTGCCDHETMQCVAKQQRVVQLHFYTLHMSTFGGGVGVSSDNTVEKLDFVNDTDCECQIVDDRPRFHIRKTRCLQCPSEFSAREYNNGVCTCDCFDKHKSCMRMKRGREPLPESDRRCVDAKRCQQPECEYGHYDLTMGRCPKKHERRNGHMHAGNGLWRIDERD